MLSPSSSMGMGERRGSRRDLRAGSRVCVTSAAPLASLAHTGVACDPTGTFFASSLHLSDRGPCHRKAMGEIGYPLPPKAAKLCAHGLKHEHKAIAALKAVFDSGQLDGAVSPTTHRTWKRAKWEHPGLLLKTGYDHVSASPDGLVTLKTGERVLIEYVNCRGAPHHSKSRLRNLHRTPRPCRVKCPAAPKRATLTVKQLTERMTIYGHHPEGVQLPLSGTRKKENVGCAISHDHYLQTQLGAFLAGANTIIYGVWVAAKTLRKVTRLTGDTIASLHGSIFATPQGSIQIIEVKVQRDWLKSYALPRAERFWSETFLRHLVLLEQNVFRRRGEVEDRLPPHLLPDTKRYGEVPPASPARSPPKPAAAEGMDVEGPKEAAADGAASRQPQKEPPYLPPDPALAAFFPISRLENAFVKHVDAGSRHLLLRSCHACTQGRPFSSCCIREVLQEIRAETEALCRTWREVPFLGAKVHSALRRGPMGGYVDHPGNGEDTQGSEIALA